MIYEKSAVQKICPYISSNCLGSKCVKWVEKVGGDEPYGYCSVDYGKVDLMNKIISAIDKIGST